MSTETAFIQVGALSDGFAPDSYILSPSDELTGKTFNLQLDRGSVVSISFPQTQRILWDGKELPCRITSIRPSIYYIRFQDPTDWRSSLCIVINQINNNCVVVQGQLPTPADVAVSAFHRIQRNLPLTDVKTQIMFGLLDIDGEPVAYTTELLGLRNRYTYNPKERYEHIYFNEQYYAWHCLDGVEKGLADVDRCHYIKVSDNLYLFVWREKIVPTLGVILIDLDELRTDGCIMGYQDEDFTEVNIFPVGAHAEILNRTP
ncbi:MoaF C-terminal domain-containing protein [Providencia rettgeri]|uniref:MoaF C-terminal domain-containing protein n=1 Tax=Providencia rettgeri TaxID=587 RepID=UPI0034E06A06